MKTGHAHKQILSPLHYLLFFGLLLFLLAMMEIPDVYGFVLFPDEFGYWTPAAVMLGYDWTGPASVGHYYGYGYAALLLPFLALIDDPVLCYRAACCLNMVLTFVLLFLLYRLLVLIEPRGNRRWYAILAGLASVYPAWIYYSQMTLAEIPVVTLYAALCVLFALFVQRRGAGRILSGIGLIFTAAYLYAVHRRTIGIVASLALCVMVTLIRDACEQRRIRRQIQEDANAGGASPVILRILLFLAAVTAVVVLAAAAYYARAYLIDGVYVYANREMIAVNSYGRQFELIRQIFTPAGIKLFIESLAGKLLYLSVATYGLFWWGMARAVRYIRRAGRLMPLYLFVFLASIANILISAIFMLEPLRYDTLIYGRYNETIVPVLLILGLLEILHMPWEEIPHRVLTVLCLTALMAAVCLQVAVEFGKKSLSGQLIPGISYWIHDELTGSVDNFEAYLLQVLLFGVCLTLFVTVLVRLIHRFPRAPQIILLLVLVQIGLGVRQQQHYTDVYNEFDFSDRQVTKKIQSLGVDEAAGVWYIYPEAGSTPFIDVIQFQMKDIPVRISAIPATAADQPYVIVNIDDPRRETDETLAGFEAQLETAHFCLYYHLKDTEGETGT